jgi:hypothetical protein
MIGKKINGQIAGLIAVLSLSNVCTAQAAETAAASKAKSTAGDNSKATAKATTGAKPKIMPWKSFAKGAEDERTYNIFKYNVSKPAVNVTNPEDWRSFDPQFFSNKKKLIPEPAVSQPAGPRKYASADFGAAHDPSKAGAVVSSGNKIVFAHQGTPLSNGWLAPQAGYAYQVDGILVYGTTNYTPINYNGNMDKFIGLSRVPVFILSSTGEKQKLDLSRLVFSVNEKLLSKPQTVVYPSVIYLKPGETASIQGHGNVKCPRPEQPEQVILPTPNGEQTIKIVCAPDNPIIPGKVSP